MAGSGVRRWRGVLSEEHHQGGGGGEEERPTLTRGVTRSQEPPVTKQRNHQKHQRGKKYLRVVQHTAPPTKKAFIFVPLPGQRCLSLEAKRSPYSRGQCQHEYQFCVKSSELARLDQIKKIWNGGEIWVPDYGGSTAPEAGGGQRQGGNLPLTHQLIIFTFSLLLWATGKRSYDITINTMIPISTIIITVFK